jgi:hypothetical protein
MTAMHPAAGSVSSAAPQAPVPSAARRRVRGTAVGVVVLANAVLWLVADALGVDFVLSDSVGTVVLDVWTVVIFTLAFALLGWGTLALLERFTSRARTTWTVLAVGVCLLSLVPIFLEHATTGTRTALVLIHLVVAAVLIPALRMHSPRRSNR